MTRELTVGVGDGASGDADLVLSIGAQHPATHGMLRLRLTLDGAVIVAADPVVGYMHRGAEKLFEVRDYRQITVLANRHDWLSAFSSELGVVLAAETMLGMEVPPRAVWLRTLLAELNRVLNHLMFLGAHPHADALPAVLAFAEREAIQAVMEEATGGRMHFMFNRVGGIREEVPAGWTSRARAAISGVRERLPELARFVGDEGAGVGVLAAPDVHAYGVSGPIARASGVDFDLRRDEPYLAYGELLDVLRVPTATAGDAHSRYALLVGQIEASLDLADACLDRLPGGAVNQRLPKTLKLPEGAVYVWTENPLGLNGYYLVSRGDKTPWRMKLRSASFNNVQALSAMLPGTMLPDLVTILGSMFFVVGDLDK